MLYVGLSDKETIMASVATNEELEKLNQNLKSLSKRVKGNRKEAIRVLNKAGITTKKGKLAAPYRVKQDK